LTLSPFEPYQSFIGYLLSLIKPYQALWSHFESYQALSSLIPSYQPFLNHTKHYQSLINPYGALFTLMDLSGALSRLFEPYQSLLGVLSSIWSLIEPYRAFLNHIKPYQDTYSLLSTHQSSIIPTLILN
jgi:hypothetical protein